MIVKLNKEKRQNLCTAHHQGIEDKGKGTYPIYALDDLYLLSNLHYILKRDSRIINAEIMQIAIDRLSQQGRNHLYSKNCKGAGGEDA